jgi:hypothetical protein
MNQKLKTFIIVAVALFLIGGFFYYQTTYKNSGSFHETRARQPPLLTLQHWSGLSPYTSSYELAGTCVFDKQSLEKRSLRPFFLQRKADLIPKLRSLFCRVPSGSFTCSPWHTCAHPPVSVLVRI